jgi:hypothetical protein
MAKLGYWTRPRAARLEWPLRLARLSTVGTERPRVGIDFNQWLHKIFRADPRTVRAHRGVRGCAA